MKIIIIYCLLIALIAFIVFFRKPFMEMKKKTKAFFFILTAILIWNHMPFYYNNNKAASYATSHAAKSSHCMCAWYVVKAMWDGGCPISLIPAYAYDKTLPQMGFEEIPSKGYVARKGDISVLPRNEGSSFGHISIYNGKQWVSDFKQREDEFPNKTYRRNGNARHFRTSDGWHWKHVWTSPIDWYDWIKSLVKGYKKITL